MEQDTQFLIQVHKGNSLSFITAPYYIDSDKPSERIPIVLGEGDYVQFAVKTHSCRPTYCIRKILTADDYDEQGNLVFVLTPQDTDLEVWRYQADLSIGFADGTFYTYASGVFEVMPTIGTVVTNAD